jgi:cell wall-associated NlpC family hydrolase
MKHRFARLMVLGVPIAVLVSLAPPAFAATPSSLDAKKAEATRLQQEIDSNGEKISMLAERYDAAQVRLGDAKQNITEVQGRIAAGEAETARIGRLVAGRAASIYMNAGTVSPVDSMDVANVTTSGRLSQYANVTADRDVALIGRLQSSRANLQVEQKALAGAEKAAQQEIDAINASRKQVEAANAQQAQLLSQVKGEIATLIRQQEARQAAIEKARSDALLAQMRQEAARQAAAASSTTAAASAVNDSGASTTTNATGVDPGNVPVPDLPAASAGAAAAVAYAKAQLGKPYVYAAAGPDAFDCSGLTMMAWAQGGVSMPHSSFAQATMFPRVSDSALQPGDLAIYYPDHHHVGIYVGGGMTISATHTGDFVRLQPVFRSGFQFAVRPG